MPGYRPRMLARCPECDGADLGGIGFPMHRPTCSTQPGSEETRRLVARAHTDRRREIDELVASPEAARLRELRTARRLGQD